MHANGIDSFWASLNRDHKWRPKHLHRHVAEMAGRDNIRDPDTEDRMRAIFTGVRETEIDMTEIDMTEIDLQEAG